MTARRGKIQQRKDPVKFFDKNNISKKKKRENISNEQKKIVVQFNRN